MLRLIDQGKLGLADPVLKYVPESRYGPNVRIHHLLAQTSGIPNPIPLKWVHLARDHALFSDSTRRLFMEQQRDLKGRLVPMTTGWHVGELDGETYLYKEGGGMGFHAEMRLYPSRRMGTILLVNSGSFNTRKNLSRLDRLVE